MVTPKTTPAQALGSQWHRWDPHLHAPGTLLNNQFGDDWERYLTEIEAATPVVRALGITDYYSIEGYRQARAFKKQGRLAGVDLLFPNVEMRLTIETARQKGINLHLLFSPDDPDHESHIERVMGQLTFPFRTSTYACRRQELERLGREVDPTQTDADGAWKVGVNQFKISLQQLRELFESERWLADNCLVAVAASEGDGTSGLQADHSFYALREEIEAFADVIFSGHASDRVYWLGRKPAMDRSAIEAKYGSIKPCLHGSDAHTFDRLLKPDGEKRCWIKAAVTFEGLRQAVVEPEERVCIGSSPPRESAGYERVESVSVDDAAWFPDATIPLNGGLVAIIGARGSGKTALADMIACGADAVNAHAGDASFLRRATAPTDLVTPATVTLDWGNGAQEPRSLGRAFAAREDATRRQPGVRYLSQQFVESLCSAAGLTGELVGEIEAVVFQAIDETDRYEAASFDELRDLRVKQTKQRRLELEAELADISRTITAEDTAHGRMPQLRVDANELSTKVAALKAELTRITPNGTEARTKRYAAATTACKEAEAAVQKLKVRRQKVADLRAHVGKVRRAEASRLEELRAEYAAIGLRDEAWSSFALVFQGSVDAILDEQARLLDDQIRGRLSGNPDGPDDHAAEPSEHWPLERLRKLQAELGTAIGMDKAKAAKVLEISKEIAQHEAKQKKVDEAFARDVDYLTRRNDLSTRRRGTYAAVFETLSEEQELLEALYAPLGAHLEAAQGAPRKLQFVVRRRVDLAAWVATGETLLDLRRGGALRGSGSLRDAAMQELMPAWTQGSAEDVAGAMERFLRSYDGDLRARKPGTSDPEQTGSWLNDLGTWLFSTSHLRLEYSIVYDGQDIERLSPGTRGIVLLTLYLEVDRWDTRPLLIDQPEENLDPKSVFDELVTYFRRARHRRQVILVTHNPNLVVNTDADQVIVASASRAGAAGLPLLHYRSGGLEDPDIRKDVCSLLEGGERAFLERERRYRFAGKRRGAP